MDTITSPKRLKKVQNGADYTQAKTTENEIFDPKEFGKLPIQLFCVEDMSQDLLN